MVQPQRSKSGYATYYTSRVFTIKLIINDSIMDSTYVEVSFKPIPKTDGSFQAPAIIDGPKTAYVGQEVTFRIIHQEQSTPTGKI